MIKNKLPMPLCRIHNNLLAIIIFVLSLNAMVTVSLINFAAKGDRFTGEDGRKLEQRIALLEGNGKYK